MMLHGITLVHAIVSFEMNFVEFANKNEFSIKEFMARSLWKGHSLPRILGYRQRLLLTSSLKILISSGNPGTLFVKDQRSNVALSTNVVDFMREVTEFMRSSSKGSPLYYYNMTKKDVVGNKYLHRLLP